MRLYPGRSDGRGIMGKRAAIYVRVSTDKQTVENQVQALRQSLSAVAGKWSSNTATLAYPAAKAVTGVLVSI